jgi:hypothetical protein
LPSGTPAGPNEEFKRCRGDREASQEKQDLHAAEQTLHGLIDDLDPQDGEAKRNLAVLLSVKEGVNVENGM